jgi:hypothetical protein
LTKERQSMTKESKKDEKKFTFIFQW